MKKLVLLSSLLFTNFIAHAETTNLVTNYSQEIFLVVRELPSGDYKPQRYTCFKVTDFLYPGRRGNGANDTFSMGPKYWYLVTSNSTKPVDEDGTCGQYFVKKANQTPNQNGTLLIYVSVSQDDDETMNFSNCSTEWLQTGY